MFIHECHLRRPQRSPKTPFLTRPCMHARTQVPLQQTMPATLFSALGLQPNSGNLLGPAVIGGGGSGGNGSGGRDGGDGEGRSGDGDDGGEGSSGDGHLLLDLRLLLLKGLMLALFEDHSKAAMLLHRAMVAATAGACINGLRWWKVATNHGQGSKLLQLVHAAATSDITSLAGAAMRKSPCGLAYPQPGSPSLPLFRKQIGVNALARDSLSLPMPPLMGGESSILLQIPPLTRAFGAMALCCVLQPPAAPPAVALEVVEAEYRQDGLGVSMKPNPLYSGSYSARARAWGAELAAAQQVEADLQDQVTTTNGSTLTPPLIPTAIAALMIVHKGFEHGKHPPHSSQSGEAASDGDISC